ncbi:MAG: YggS family pyridoxal phosphate-dependent enzyme [Treponema sp.]|jgi:pyridoxal phosphate enzyme (YggS family)|nr:YggS family pyridoxal phosphate-dependent enzyme [Treponema sp.]
MCENETGMSIAGNIARIEERIQRACGMSGRRRDEITLMAVSKFQPVDLVEEAFNAGIRCFGESRVKEGTEKFGGFRKGRPDLQLHLIGSLQRNKAKSAALFFDCIQSVDREALIGELVKSAGLREKPLPVLLELHTGEESKSGFADFDALFRAAEIVANSAVLEPRGLMTMAPFTTEKALVRSSFGTLAKAQKEMERRFPPKENWACLSMGMSNDFEIAIEEGSTLLRIGSSIFKE